MGRGQTATEYLILLAVVIIIALIVIGALGGIPGIAGSTSTNNVVWTSGLFSIDHVALGGKSINGLQLRNNLPNTVRIEGIYIGGALNDKTNIVRINKTVGAGKIYNFKGASVLSSACTQGDMASLYITVRYLDVVTGAVYNYTANDAPFNVECGGIFSCVGLSNQTRTSGDDVVYCDTTGSMWTQQLASNYTWGVDDGVNYYCTSYMPNSSLPACDACHGLEYAGFSDWSLPACDSRTEDSDCQIYSFYTDACSSSSTCSDVEVWDSNFDGSGDWSFYSRTGYTLNTGMMSGDPGENAIVLSETGLANSARENSNFVRCVRDGS